MDPLNRLSTGRPGLTTDRLDGRKELSRDSAKYQDLLERASVVTVGEPAHAAEPEPRDNPLVQLLERCAYTLGRWARMIVG